MPANLERSLLLRIMEYLGEHRDVYPDWVTTPDLLSLVPDLIKSEGQQKALSYIDRHCHFLVNSGYLQSGTPSLDVHRALRLTHLGEMVEIASKVLAGNAG